jgi:enamine deaminase RidA (YjgF/YER057c/UK114 family)
MTRIDRTLEAAGLTHADIVDTTVYLPDTWQQPQVAKVLREADLRHADRWQRRRRARLAARAGLVELVVTAWR